MVLVITIALWDVWKVVALLWCVQVVLRCVNMWATAQAGTDWRIVAWSCQWSVAFLLVRILLGDTALSWTSLHQPEPDFLWLLALVLLGLHATIDVAESLVAIRRRIVPPFRDNLRWRYFMLRLWHRKLTRQGPRHALTAVHRRFSMRRAATRG